MSLKGRHALITGGSRGIGRGIALKLAESGVKVAVNYYQNEAAAKDTLAKIRERGSDGFLIQADVCQAVSTLSCGPLHRDGAETGNRRSVRPIHSRHRRSRRCRASSWRSLSLGGLLAPITPTTPL